MRFSPFNLISFVFTFAAVAAVGRPHIDQPSEWDPYAYQQL